MKRPNSDSIEKIWYFLQDNYAIILEVVFIIFMMCILCSCNKNTDFGKEVVVENIATNDSISGIKVRYLGTQNSKHIKTPSNLIKDINVKDAIYVSKQKNNENIEIKEQYENVEG